MRQTAVSDVTLLEFAWQEFKTMVLLSLSLTAATHAVRMSRLLMKSFGP